MVLLVDDEPSVLFTLQEVLAERGHRTVSAMCARHALEKLEDVDAVVTDLQMPGMDGMDLLRMIRERHRLLPVVLVTAHGNEEVAVSAMKAGAFDYLRKPFDPDEAALIVERALESRQLHVMNRRLVAERAMGRRLIADSAPMRRLLEAVERLAEKDVTVLIRGETGTGKELIASLLHAQSGRSKNALVRFNCAAIPAELAESELFGHTKGAFTGAQANRPGFFAEAHGGTLVLDEVGELPAGVQAKLLRALQGGEIQPVGSARTERVDVRVIASTNRDLRADADSGRFREDLYYRLAVVELYVPPLRERRDDIPNLAEEFARQYARKFGLEDVRLSEGLLARLRDFDWPGNVRQLENTVARLAALSTGGILSADAFDPTPPARDAAVTEGTGNCVDGPSWREQMEAFERNLIARALSSASGNQSEAARLLAMSRVTFIGKMKKYRLR